jgi:hypothetical protein
VGVSVTVITGECDEIVSLGAAQKRVVNPHYFGLPAALEALRHPKSGAKPAFRNITAHVPDQKWKIRSLATVS